MIAERMNEGGRGREGENAKREEDVRGGGKEAGGGKGETLTSTGSQIPSSAMSASSPEQ